MTHFLEDRPAFLGAVHRWWPIVGLVPIPSSVRADVRRELSNVYPLVELTLEEMLDGGVLQSLADEHATKDPRPLAILDIGGYFSTVGNWLKGTLGDRFLGVVEDTESGHRRYEAIDLQFPVVSVARSRLKLIEDRLIGPSVVFSVERMLRSLGQTLAGAVVGVLGYGKIGSSVARAARGRGVHVITFDILSRQRALAVADAILAPDRDRLLETADVIIGAAGQQSLHAEDISKLRDGVVLASASSKRIEFDVAALEEAAFTREDRDEISRFTLGDGRVVHLIADGTPVNFLDGAVVGPAITLVQAELIVGLKVLEKSRSATGLIEVPLEEQTALADLWIESFFRRDGSGTMSIFVDSAPPPRWLRRARPEPDP